MNFEDIRRRETAKALKGFFKKKKPFIKIRKYLDLGCGDGSFTIRVANILRCTEVYG